MKTKLILILTAGIFLFAACGNKTSKNQIVNEGTYYEQNCNITIEIAQDKKFRITEIGYTTRTGVYEITLENGETYVQFGEISGLYHNDTIDIQNYGNAMNEYTHFGSCGEKYISFIKT
jgi:hypothetical protein